MLDPLEMVVLVTPVVQEELLKNWPPPEVLLRFTVVLLETLELLPEPFCVCTCMAGEHWPAATEKVLVVNASLGSMVSVCEALALPEKAVAVRLGLSTELSLKKKLAELAPEEMVTLLVLVVQVEFV